MRSQVSVWYRCRRRAAASGRPDRKEHTPRSDTLRCPNTPFYRLRSLEEDTRCCLLSTQTHTTHQTLKTSAQHQLITRLWPLTCQLTCAVGVSLTGGVDGLLTDFTFSLELAVFTAGAVPVTEHRERIQLRWEEDGWRQVSVLWGRL